MFNGFDILAAVLLLLLAFLGFRAGIIAGLFFCFSGFAGMWTADRFSARLGMGFFLTFALTVALFLLLGFVLSKLAKVVMLGIPDRIAGALLGALAGAFLLVSVIIPSSAGLSPGVRRMIAHSAAVSRVVPRVRSALPWLPAVRFSRLRDTARKRFTSGRTRLPQGLKLILKKDKIKQ